MCIRDRCCGGDHVSGPHDKPPDLVAQLRALASLLDDDVCCVADEGGLLRAAADRLDALAALEAAARQNRSARGVFATSPIVVGRLKASQEQIDAALDALDTQEGEG